MMERLKLAFKENIPYVEWMEEVTKEKTREKVDLMKQVVAYLNLHADAESLDRNYEHVVIITIVILSLVHIYTIKVGGG